MRFRSREECISPFCVSATRRPNRPIHLEPAGTGDVRRSDPVANPGVAGHAEA
jgi:hypothetical protein